MPLNLPAAPGEPSGAAWLWAGWGRGAEGTSFLHCQSSLDSHHVPSPSNTLCSLCTVICVYMCVCMLYYVSSHTDSLPRKALNYLLAHSQEEFQHSMGYVWVGVLRKAHGSGACQHAWNNWNTGTDSPAAAPSWKCSGGLKSTKCHPYRAVLLHCAWHSTRYKDVHTHTHTHTHTHAC